MKNINEKINDWKNREKKTEVSSCRTTKEVKKDLEKIAKYHNKKSGELIEILIVSLIKESKEEGIIS